MLPEYASTRTYETLLTLVVLPALYPSFDRKEAGIPQLKRILAVLLDLPALAASQAAGAAKEQDDEYASPDFNRVPRLPDGG
jgi:hypothetical protein